jgi:virulence factor Mce-like protein
MGTKPPRPAALGIALAFVLSCVGFLMLVWLEFGGSTPLQAKGYRIHALLGLDAVNLAPNSSVRIAGVSVGKVVNTQVRGGRVDATMELQRRFEPLPSDSRVIVRTKTLIGETFLELTPGTAGAPKLHDGATLPASHAQQSVTIDDLLSQFDAPTRRDFKKTFVDIGAALNGRGRDLNVFWGSLGPAFDDLNRLVKILDEQRPDFERFVRDGGVALRAISARGAQLQSLITAGDRVLTATAARNRELTQTVRELPGFLASLRGSLSSLETTAAVAAPTVHVLRPVAPLLRPGLEGVSELTPQLRGVFRQLRPVTRAMPTGLPALSRIVDNVRPLIDALDPAGQDIVPILRMLTAYDDEIISTMATVGTNLSYSLKGRVGQTVYPLHVLPPFTNEMNAAYSHRPGTNRHNALLPPGGLAKLVQPGGLEAWDCRNASNPTPIPPLGTGTPPCRQQGPWTFQGQTAEYPHVERSR